jgi:transposase-like protein
MARQTQQTRQPITATVEAVNERRIKIDGTWHNYSRYADGAIDRTAQVGDTVQVVLTNTGWVRALRIVQRAAQQNGQAVPPAAGASAAPRALDAEQYARLRAVEIASPVAAQYAQSAGEYLQTLAALANWIALYITEGDPLENGR